MSIAVGDRMFLGMQDFDFVQIYQICPNLSNLPKPDHFWPKFRLSFAQIQSNLLNSNQF